MTADETDALGRFLRLYKKLENKIDYVFAQMDQIGNPEKRKYNTPLQAFYWLVKDGYLEEAEELAKYYDLEKLLVHAWLLEHTRHLNRWKWRMKEAKRLYENCQDNRIKGMIAKFNDKNKGAVDYIISLAERYPESFSVRYVSFKKEIKKNRKRWKNFQEVVERINSPELVHYYIKNDYNYAPDVYGTPKEIFETKTGNASAMADLGEYLLKNGGMRLLSDS